MSPSPLLHPVGPEPTRTYWLRRAVLIGALVVLIVAVAYACSGSSGDNTNGRDRLRTGKPEPTAPASTSSAPVRRCGPKLLRVKAATDAATYPVGSAPRLTAVVRNTSADPCRLATQPSARTWSITSGADEVWSTADCAQPDHVVLKRLKSDHQVTYAVTWDGHRSQSGCASPGDEAQPGTYRLEVTVDGVHSGGVIFHLTG